MQAVVFLTRQVGRNFAAPYALLRPREKKTWLDTKPLTRRTRGCTAAIAGRGIRGMTTSRDIKKSTASKADTVMAIYTFISSVSFVQVAIASIFMFDFSVFT
jgi:hypothetical protein